MDTAHWQSRLNLTSEFSKQSIPMKAFRSLSNPIQLFRWLAMYQAQHCLICVFRAFHGKLWCGIEVFDWKISWQNNWFRPLYQWVGARTQFDLNQSEQFCQLSKHLRKIRLFGSHWTWKVRTQRCPNFSAKCIPNTSEPENKSKHMAGSSNRFVNRLKRHSLISSFNDLFYRCVDIWLNAFIKFQPVHDTHFSIALNKFFEFLVIDMRDCMSIERQ